jgi:hypothetical protein
MSPEPDEVDRAAEHLRAHGATLGNLPDHAVAHIRALGALISRLPEQVGNDPESLRSFAGTLSYWSEWLDRAAARSEVEVARLVESFVQQWQDPPQ